MLSATEIQRQVESISYPRLPLATTVLRLLICAQFICRLGRVGHMDRLQAQSLVRAQGFVS